MNLGADVIACAGIVERGDPERFAAVMASPVAARPILFPLYAFNVEVARAPWVTQETMIAEMRLQWWRDALEEIGEGKQVRRHEVVTPLRDILDATGAAVLDRLVAARRWDIYKDAFEDAAHFDRYLEETSGALMWVAVRALAAAQGAPLHAGSEAQVRALGRATGLARFLQAVPALESQNRIPLVDGRTSAVAALAREAMRAAPGRTAIKKSLPKAARPAVTEAYLTRAVLTQAAAAPARVGEGTLSVNPMLSTLQLWCWS